MPIPKATTHTVFGLLSGGETQLLPLFLTHLFSEQPNESIPLKAQLPANERSSLIIQAAKVGDVSKHLWLLCFTLFRPQISKLIEMCEISMEEDIDVVDSEGRSALHYAVEKGYHSYPYCKGLMRTHSDIPAVNILLHYKASPMVNWILPNIRLLPKDLL